MRIFFIIALFCVISLPAHAAINPTALRDLAYAHDIDGAEAAMAEAQAETMDGQLSVTDLRALVTVLNVSHPDVVDFVNDWLTAYPASPYAQTIRARQMSRAAWMVRGNGSVRQTHPLAISTFHQTMDDAMTLALQAYGTDPDFVPASDAIFRLQFATNTLSIEEYLAIVDHVMAVRPSRETIKEALNEAMPKWGGMGRPLINYICGAHADQVPSLVRYTPDICIAENIVRYLDISVDPDFVDRVLDTSNHPALDEARRERALRRKTDDDRALLAAYLSDPAVLDYEVADRAARAVGLGPQTAEILDALDARLQADAEARLLDDPFNPDIILVLTHKYPPISSYTQNYDDRYRLLLRRLVVVEPFNPAAWKSVTYALLPERSPQDVADFDPYFENAIYYDNHSFSTLSYLLLVKLAYYRDFNELWDGPVAASDLPMGDAQLQADVVCPIARLSRLIALRCEATGTAEDCAAPVDGFDFYTDLLSQIDIQRICPMISAANTEDLLYSPVPIDPGPLTIGMANR